MSTFFIKSLFQHIFIGGDIMTDKLLSLLGMTLAYLFKDTAKDKAELVLAIASLVREIKDLVVELRKLF